MAFEKAPNFSYPLKLIPRVDVTSKFRMKILKKGRGVELDYGIPDGAHGLEVGVDGDGVFGFNIRAEGNAQTMGSGRDMFISAMQRLKKEGIAVNKIRGCWIENSDSVNISEFLRNLSTMPEKAAAANTWTGRIAHDFEFTEVISVERKPGRIIVVFGRKN